MSDTHKPKVIAGEAALLARRYAQALLELAEERKVLAPVADDLSVMQDVIDNDPAFLLLAKHPRLSADKVFKVVDAIVEKAKFHDLTKDFLKQLVRGHRLFLLELVIDFFQAETARKRGEVAASVTTAKALSEAQQEALTKQLTLLAKGPVKVRLEEDPELLGGLVIKLGSRLIDASVKGKLVRMERQLKKQQEAA